jgi:hypothetical protein
MQTWFSKQVGKHDRNGQRLTGVVVFPYARTVYNEIVNSPAFANAPTAQVTAIKNLIIGHFGLTT